MLFNTKEGSVKINDNSIDYVSFGRGKKPLVIIPGLSLNRVKGAGLSLAYMYRIYVKDYRVYIFDRKEIIKEGYTIKEISKDKLNNVTEKLNDYNIYNKPVQQSSMPISNESVGNTINYSTRPDVEKTNVNVDPDKIVINNKNAISDDAFFDDFFGEDE